MLTGTFVTSVRYATCEKLPFRGAIPAVVAVLVRRTTRPRNVYPRRGRGLQPTSYRAGWHERHVFPDPWQRPCQGLLLFRALQVVAQVLEWSERRGSHAPLFVPTPLRLGSRWGHRVKSAFHVRPTAAASFFSPASSARPQPAAIPYFFSIATALPPMASHISNTLAHQPATQETCSEQLNSVS
jgi:hypothetical protein